MGLVASIISILELTRMHRLWTNLCRVWRHEMAKNILSNTWWKGGFFCLWLFTHIESQFHVWSLAAFSSYFLVYSQQDTLLSTVLNMISKWGHFEMWRICKMSLELLGSTCSTQYTKKYHTVGMGHYRGDSSSLWMTPHPASLRPRVLSPIRMYKIFPVF